MRKIEISRRSVVGGGAASLFGLTVGLPRLALAEEIESATFEQVLEAAKSEGTFVIYDSIPPDQSAQVLQAFQAKYPEITPQYIEVSSNTRVARIIQESQAGGPTCDFATKNPAATMQLARDGYLRGIDWAALGIETSPERAPNPYMIATHATANIELYNTNEVAEVELPTKYEDLLDPKWQGRIGMWGNPSTMLGLIYSWGEEKVTEYMKSLAALSPQLFRTPYAAAEAVSAGEVDFGLFLPHHAALDQVHKGAPVKTLWLEPVATGPQFGYIPKAGAYPNAAKLYVSWVTSSEAATIVESATGRSNPFAEGTELAASLEGKELSLEDIDASIEQTEHMDELGNTYMEILQGRA